jgi:membrane protein DedA with SNARE-associated domain
VKRLAAVTWPVIVPALLHIHIHIHLHHHFHGPPFDYAGLAIAAALSWIGLPGPGEPVLFAAAVLAARHQLDLATVVGVAFLAAAAGGIVGWGLGLRFGRPMMVGRGPLRAARLRALKRGEAMFERHPVIGILVTPALVSGIHRVPSRIYQPVNAVSALVWAVGIGVGGYLIGPPVLDVFDDLGLGFTGVFVLAIVVGAAVEVARRRRRASRSDTPA